MEEILASTGSAALPRGELVVRARDAIRGRLVRVEEERMVREVDAMAVLVNDIMVINISGIGGWRRWKGGRW